MITFDNYHDGSNLIFKRIDFTPEREPDYISYKISPKKEQITFTHENFNSDIEFLIQKVKEHFDKNFGEFKFIDVEFRTLQINKKGESYKYILQTRISMQTNEVSSKYWHGTDNKGDFVIRQSAHWGQINDVCNWELIGKNDDEIIFAKTYIS